MMGPNFEVLAPVLGSGYRRRRGEDDINDLESSPPHRRKLCPTIDLTKDGGLSRMTQSLKINNAYPYRISDFRFNPCISGSQSRAQQCAQPTNRMAPENERTAWYNSSNPLTSHPKFGIFDIPGLRKGWGVGRLNEPRASFPSDQSPRPRIRTVSPRPIPTPSASWRTVGKPPFPNPRTPNRAKSLEPSRSCATAFLHPTPENRGVEIESVNHKGHSLRARKTVELQDGTFLRIASIKNRISDYGQDQIFLEGTKYQRAREFLGLLALKKNEVALSSVCETVPLSEVHRPRILIVTNAAFPKYRDISGHKEIDEREGRLICRWRLNMISKQEGYIWRLEEHEVDKEYRVEDSELRENWRGKFAQLAGMLEEGVSRENPQPPRKDLCGEEGFVGQSSKNCKLVDLVSPEPERQGGVVKETHHAGVVTNGRSIELKETSYGPYQRGGSSVTGGSSTYEATIDSRTPAGRFRGYFQGTYTPNPSPYTQYNSSFSSLYSSPASFSGLPPQGSKVSSTVSSPWSLGKSVAGTDLWSSNPKQLGLFNNSSLSPLGFPPRKQRYHIPGPLEKAAGGFGSSLTHRDISVQKYTSHGKPKSDAPFSRLYPSSESLGPALGRSPPSSQPSTPTKRRIPPKPIFSKSITPLGSPSLGSSNKYRYLQSFDRFLKKTRQPPQPASNPSHRRKYTFGDAFCGGGGMSSGARSAGFINAWGFDFNMDAVETYRRNFPDCMTYHASASDFVAFPPEELFVDVVHLSPPCQPHSPAHTVIGKDDDRNEASLFCVKECLEVSRPRVVTLEQTDGILNRQEWFRSLVMCFTDLGFSVSWKVLHGVEHGVPQARKRLFLLAASPGEALPNFPAPKYAHPRDKDLPSRLPPPRTVRNAIGYIPRDSTSHEPIPFPDGFRPSPVDFDQPLKATILASGGPYDVHPSGLRPFTPRELACLQTFPVTHYFSGSTSQRKKQIGNAVPPVLAEALLREVRKTLEKADRERSKKVEKVAQVSETVEKGNDKGLQTVISIFDDEGGGEAEILRSHKEVSVVVVD